jgi:hypothetical protein
MLCDNFVRYGLCLLHALHTALPYYCTNGVLYSLYHISVRKYSSSHPETNEFMAVLFCWFEGPSRHHRQAQKLILGPSPTTKTGLLLFNRTQSRFVMGLLTGHNTLRRHLHLMGLSNNPHAGGVVQRKKPQSAFCMSVKLWLHSDILLLGPRGY